ncbi:hypothetical protein REPUB_Repub14bG0150700 [Reevesia pubescens]
MGEIECKPPIQVIIESSIVTIPEKSHSLSINNVTEPSDPSNSILTRLHADFTVLCLHPPMFLSLSLGEGRVRAPYRKKRFLSIMANPTSQISVIGNLVAARAVAQMGWKESAVCMWSLGMVHYLVLFITLYQRLSGGNSLPLKLRPTFFLFFAAPSMASLAWNSITGVFDTTSKMLFFFSLFLFLSLACRPSLFKKSMRKSNVAWWAYSFPLTFLALAAAEYAQEVKGRVATVLMLMLSGLSILVLVGLMLLTATNTERLLSETDPNVTSSNNLKSST